MALSVLDWIKILRSIPYLITLCLLVNLSITAGQAQGNRPITKEDFLSSLELGQKEGKSSADFTKLIKLHGVDFRTISDDEVQIRQVGKYLGTRGLDDLLKALNDNYHAYRGERLRVSLFNYVPCSDYQEQLTELLRSKVNALPSRLTGSSDQYKYIGGLKLVKEGKPFNMSLDEADRYWETTRSLQLLEGTCKREDKDVFVISHVFLGNLRGPLKSPLRIKFKIDPEEYGNTRDVHSLLILYSLAREAQARGIGREVIIRYLAEAAGIASQIKHPDHLSTLQPIRSAIEGMLRDLGAINLMDVRAQ